MALRFMDGFDHYAVPADIPRKYTSYNDSGSSIGLTGITGRRAGSTALQLRVSIDYVSLTLDDQQTWIVGFAINLSGSESTDLVRFYDNTGAVQAALAISSGGMLQLYRGGTLLATATTALAINTWAYIETKLTIADSGGVFEARLNESVVVTFTGDTKQSSTLNTANRIYFVGRGSKNAIDDLYICDGTGTVNNGYGFSPAAYISSLRCALSVELSNKNFLASRSISVHGFCAIDVSRKSARHRSLFACA